MTAFRLLLASIFIVISAYTVIVIADHGPNLFPVFFGDVADLTWRGQFNVDFMCFLALSALWVMWRHAFSPVGLALGIVAFFGGALFLSIYLLVAGFQVNGDQKALLLGTSRV